MRRASRMMRPLVGIVGFLLLWEAACRLLHIKDYVLPAPSMIVANIAGHWQGLLYAALFTLQPMVLGFLVAVVAGVLIALGVAFSPAVQGLTYPLLVFLQIVPKIAVAPLFIIWFGFGLMPKVLLVFLLSFFPIVVAAITAFRSIEPEIIELVRSTGAPRWRVFRMVQLPHALPALFGGFKVAAALAATAAVVAEFVASDRGLGFLLMQYNGDLDTAGSFAAIFILSALGLLLYGAVEVLEGWAVPWHVSRRRANGDTPGI
jgi:NitT/TauT family transport system permease protein